MLASHLGRCARLALACPLAAVVLAAAPASHAATAYTITSTSMAMSGGDGICTLAEALLSAQNNATVNECVATGGPYTIDVDPGTYVFTTSNHNDANFGLGAYGFTAADVSIAGTGPGVVFQRDPAGDTMRLFNLGSFRSVLVSNLTVSGFNASNTGAPVASWGGALASLQATLNLDRVTLTGNSAPSDGLAILAVASTVNILGSTISGNTSSNTLNSGQFRLTQNTMANIANSTINGDRMAVINTSGSTANLSNVTLSGQLALLDDATATTNVRNSAMGTPCQLTGTATTSNIAGPGSCGGAGTPILLALAANGGPTSTRLILVGTAAQNAAPACTYLSSGANPLFSNGAAIVTDQRGFPRDALCDLGAVELFDISALAPFGATFGVPYLGNITAAGATSPYTFAAVSPLPSGLSLASDGTLAGTPTAANLWTFDVEATDANGFISTRRYSAFPVARAAQAITFAPLPDVAFGTAPFVVAATSDSALNVTLTSLTPGVCTVDVSKQVTVLAVGTCTLRATQAGNVNYNAATLVDQGFEIFAVLPAAPTIGTASAGNTTVLVAFTAPAFDGGAPITLYTATCGAASATSATATPITVTGVPNGVPVACTVRATNSVGQGPASSASNTVTPVSTSITGTTPQGPATATLTGGGAGCTFANAGTGPLESAGFIPVTGHPKSPPAAPANVRLPFGLLDFVLLGCTPGSTVSLTVSYSQAVAPGSQYWKYGPTPTNPVTDWYVLPATIAGNTVTFSIVDGGLGDDDLAANGQVVDQGGPGVAAAGAFVAVPTLSQWEIALLALALLACGLRRTRARGA